MHISSSYAKILGEKLFRTWEIPRSGSKAKDGGKKRGEKESGEVEVGKLVEYAINDQVTEHFLDNDLFHQNPPQGWSQHL